MTTARKPWIRVPRVHTGNGPPPDPETYCRDICVTCRTYRRHCNTGPCAPICEKTNIRRGPIHVCLVTTYAAGRLIIRENRPQTTYIGPSGIEWPPPPLMWPLLVVDHCPHQCGHVHLHTIRDPGPVWFRTPPTCRPYVIFLRRAR